MQRRETERDRTRACPPPAKIRVAAEMRTQTVILLGLLTAAPSYASSSIATRSGVLEDAPKSCIEESLSYARWEVSSFHAEAVPGTKVAFTLNNKATGSTVKCESTAKTETWSKCTDDKASFRFANKYRTLIINETWNCPEHFGRPYALPIDFSTMVTPWTVGNPRK